MSPLQVEQKLNVETNCTTLLRRRSLCSRRALHLVSASLPCVLPMLLGGKPSIGWQCGRTEGTRQRKNVSSVTLSSQFFAFSMPQPNILR